MKTLFYLILPLLAACSPNRQTETAAETEPPHAPRIQASSTPSAPAVSDGMPNLTAEHTDKVKMTGNVHFSLEQAEFVTPEKTYYIINSYGLNALVKAKREYSGAYNVTLNDVCIQGKVFTKEDNKGSRFGALARYEQAVAVAGLC